MAKINQEEYEVLKGLDDKWKWIARDKDRGLYAFTEKPVRKYDPSPYWDTETEWPYASFESLDEIHLFQFIQWEDEEPYNIAELIEEYEGEEKEVKKDIKWLMQWIEEYESEVIEECKDELKGIVRAHSHGKQSAIKRIKQKIDQLDESEVLSKEWISENVEYAYFDMLDGSGRLSSATAIIKPKKLRNLLVPKQEEVDRAYKDGYEKGKEHTFYKGYLEGLAESERKTNEYFESITEEPSYDQVQKYLSEHGFEVVEKEPERVADVVTTFWKSYERLKEVMSMEVKELEE